MKTQLEYFQEHAKDGLLSDDHMAVLVTLPEGDTPLVFADPEEGEAKPDGESGKPDAAGSKPADDTAAQAEKKDEGQQPPADGAKPDDKPQGEEGKTPVILAKDGVHTIEYQKLVDAREAEKAAREAADAAKAEAERLRQEIATLKAQPPAAAKPADATTDDPAKAGAKPGDTGDAQVDFGDYSDAAIAKAVAQLVAQHTAPLQAELEALRGQKGEAEAKARLEAQQAHYAAIYKAHPDADSIAESAELKGYIEKLPKLYREAAQATLAKGETADIIDLFTAFKEATGKTGAAQPGAADAAAKAAAETKTKADAAAAAQAAIDAATTKPPTSLSEIPAGSSAHHDPAAAMLESSSSTLLDKFLGKDPNEIMRMLDKVL